MVFVEFFMQIFKKHNNTICFLGYIFYRSEWKLDCKDMHKYRYWWGGKGMEKDKIIQEGSIHSPALISVSSSEKSDQLNSGPLCLARPPPCTQPQKPLEPQEKSGLRVILYGHFFYFWITSNHTCLDLVSTAPLNTLPITVHKAEGQREL